MTKSTARAVSVLGRILNRVADTHIGLITIQQATILMMRRENMSIINQMSAEREAARKSIGDLQKSLVQSRNECSRARTSIKSLGETVDALRGELSGVHKSYDETYDLLRFSTDPLNAPLIDIARARMRELATLRMSAIGDLPPDSEAMGQLAIPIRDDP